MNLVRKLIELDNASPKRILIAGDAMTDVYVQGRLEDTCQEGCPKFVEESTFEVPGGSANAERSLTWWLSSWLLHRCSNLEDDMRKTRLMVGDKCVMRIDDEFATGYLTENRRHIIQSLSAGWPQCPHAVLLPDYDKGFLTPEFIRQVADLCRERGIPCVADAKRDPSVYAGCILKCNEEYAKKFLADLCKFHGPIIITRGEKEPIVLNKCVDDQEELTKIINA